MISRKHTWHGYNIPNNPNMQRYNYVHYSYPFIIIRYKHDPMGSVYLGSARLVILSFFLLPIYYFPPFYSPITSVSSIAILWHPSSAHCEPRSVCLCVHVYKTVYYKILSCRYWKRLHRYVVAGEVGTYRITDRGKVPFFFFSSPRNFRSTYICIGETISKALSVIKCLLRMCSLRLQNYTTRYALNIKVI